MKTLQTNLPLVLSLLFVFGQSVQAAESPENLAIGKKYTLSPKPTYKHCTDPDDTIQLTDGQTTDQYFWTQKGTVGWQSVPFAVITVDLEKSEPIGGVEMTSAAGTAGVTWPTTVFVHVSDDGKNFRDAGELISLDVKAHGPLPEKYAIRCFSARELQAKGRFVRFIVLSSGNFIFTDEIRIFRYEGFLHGSEADHFVESDPAKFVEKERFRLSIHRRQIDDMASLRKITVDANIDDDARKNISFLNDTIERSLEEVRRLGMPGGDLQKFRTVFPIQTLHREIFQALAMLWKESGMTVHAVPVSPWDKATLFEIPSKEFLETKNPIEVHAMCGEYRAAAFNIYNAEEKPITVSLRIDGIPPSEFTVHDVPWTDTAQFEPVLAALPLADQDNDVFSVTVLPGLVKQVYLTFRPVNLPPKLYETNIFLNITGENPRSLDNIPLKLTVWPMQFPEKTSLLVGGWSYTNGNGAYSVNPKNRDSFLRHLQEHFVNAPWARPSVVMNFEYDKTNNSVTLNTKEFDDWHAQWPNAREYCIFLSVPPTIKGIKHDVPEFDAAVAAWITAWVEHWKSKGIEPERFNLLVSDEPGLDFDLAPTFAWGKAIRKAQPKLKLWVDPVYTDLKKAPTEIFERNDVICPNRPQWLQNRKGFDAFYLDWQKKDKKLQLYSCSGPVRLLDPYAYFRLQAWDVARIHGTGSFFWAFGDGGGASSWNEYLAPRTMYTPLFIDPNDPNVVGAKQMEAMREGIEDFETIQMLRNLIARRKTEGKPTDAAETVLKESLESVFAAEGVDRIFWKDAKDRSVADKARIRILETIKNLSPTQNTVR